jgi:hypothetical protein
VVKPRLKGEAYEIRFADDFILCFQYREDAEKVLEVLHQRFAKYGLQLDLDKTRLIEFGPTGPDENQTGREEAGHRSAPLQGKEADSFFDFDVRFSGGS